jgi:drug/metabolite transporter (DMT)-like permease
MLAVVLIWGVNFTIVKIALRTWLPLPFNSIRFTVATLAMLVILRLRGESLSLRRRDVLPMLLLGLGGHTIYQWLFINGLARTTPGNTSLLMATAPIFVAVYSHVLAMERANRTVWAGILLSFGGVVLLILGGADGIHLESGAIAGDLMVLGASMLWAAYTVGSKPLLGRYSATKLTALAMVAGVPPLILTGWSDMMRQDWAAIPPMHWLAMLYSALISVVIGYTLWGISVKRVGNARTAIYSNVTPVIAVVTAFLVLGDQFTLLQMLGAAVVLAGLLLTRQGRVQ